MKNYYFLGYIFRSKFIPVVLMSLLFMVFSAEAFSSTESENHPAVFQKKISVSGIVKDSHGEPLAGATVVIKGTTTGTTTNATGKFQLTVNSKKAILVVSFVGFTTQKLLVGDKTYFNVILKEVPTGLNEVIVVGYGTSKKSDLTGAISSVNADQLTIMSNQNPLSAIQGKMAGVNITKTSGAPGAAFMVRIRGIGTINNSNPIYIVDGFPVSDISYLSVNDIKSVEVLKDASATAIYGSRGANGVILVTTKKANKAGVHFSLNYNYGVQSATKQIPMLNAWQFATLYREAETNAGLILTPYENKVTQYVIAHKSIGTNWQNLVFQKFTPVQNINLSFSGRTGRNTYLASIFYNTNKGLVKYNNFSKLDLHLSNMYTISDKITLDIGVFYSRIDRHEINNGTLNSALYMDPITQPWDKNTNNYGAKMFNQIEATNPALLIDNSKYNGLSYTNRFVGNVGLTVKDLFINGLSFKSLFGIDSKEIQGKGYWPKYYVDISTYNSESSLYQNRRNIVSIDWTNYLTYNKILRHNIIKVTLGTEMLGVKDGWTSATAYDIPNDPNLMYFNLAQDVNRKTLEGTIQDYRLLSYFARVNYKFKDRYLLTASVRADGSSKFINKNRWGVFPSVAVAWNIKNESFLKDIDVISSLKIRAGWGVVGNQNSLNNPYAYASTITQLSRPYVLGGNIVNGYYPNSLANKNIKWESTETYNIGIDLALFEYKLTVNANVFQNTTRDMIAAPQAPLYVGYQASPSNIGSVRNRGVGVSLGYNDNAGDFHYRINFNITTFKNKVLSLGTSSAIIAGMLPRLDPTTYTMVGGEIGAFWGLKTHGIFTQKSLDALHAKYPNYQPNAKPGDVWFVDYNGDHRIDKVGDRQYLGSAIPDFTGGLNIQLNWKNFDLNMYFLGSYGNKIVDGQYVYIHGSNIKSNWSADMWNRSHGNIITNIPRLTVADPNGNSSTFSDRYVKDGSYLRFKNLQIGFNFPESVCNKMKLSGFRIYFSADNLFTLTKYPGWDPEPVSYGTLNGGVDYGTYPLSRVFSLGINLKF